MAAQTSVGLVLGALVWARPLRPWAATALLLAAIALAVLLPVEGAFLREMGMTLEPTHTKTVLKLAAALATVAALVTRQWRFALIAAVGEAVLWPITNYIEDCDLELAAAHLAFFGLLVGCFRPRFVAIEPPVQGEGRRQVRPDALLIDDLVAFGVGTVAACLTCWVVLRGQTDSADEWADTFQAALFAKFHAYGAVPHCSEAFRSFWVYQYMGRSFAQYTPGWPLFMTPFVALRVPWLAGPASLGLLAAGASRLGRRAAAGFSPGTVAPSPEQVRAAGWFAAGAVVLSSTLLINGGSRYPHVFVTAMYAFCIEALCAVSTDGLSERQQRRYGILLGSSAALILASRPGDGAMLGVGLSAYFFYAVVRRRIEWRSVSTAAAAGGVIGGISLIVLRLQLGEWFRTGYSLTGIVYPWAKLLWSLPKANEFRWGIPIATGSYCWWPCSPAVGLAGLASMRGRSRRIGFIFFFGAIPLLILYTLSEFGRGYDVGYGPRYVLLLVLPMAIGTGVAFAGLWSRARGAGGPALALGGPFAVAVVAVVLGVVRIAPLVYPYAYADVKAHNRLHDAIDHADLHDAIVFGGPGLNTTDPMDLPENLPLDSYPDQDVLIAIDRSPDEVKCVRDKYRGRTLYRAIPGEPVRIVRY